MKVKACVLFALSLLVTTFGAPAMAQHVDPHHSGIVVAANCNPETDTVSFATQGGHHVLLINHGSPFVDVGFAVFGNAASVLHGQIPQSDKSAGPLPIGNLTFKIISVTASANAYLNSGVISDTGNNLPDPIDDFPIHSGQTVTIPLTRPSTGDGTAPAFVQVYFDSHGDLPFRAVVGDFAINGFPLPAAVTHLNDSNGSLYCGD